MFTSYGVLFNALIYWILALFVLFAYYGVLATTLKPLYANLKANQNLLHLIVMWNCFSGFLFLRHHPIDYLNLFYLNKSTYKWLLLLFTVVVISFMINCLQPDLNLGATENKFAAVALFLFWLLMLQSATLLALLLLLELANIALLLIFLFQFKQNKTQRASTIIAKNSAYAFVNSIILFLWVSAFSVLGLLFFLFLICPNSSNFNFITINAYFYFYTQITHTSLLSSLPGLLLVLKLMFFPWQAVMFSFYSGLSLQNFASYLIFFYTNLLLLLIKTILPIFITISHSWFWLFITLSPLFLGVMFVLITKTYDIKTTFVVSSLLSITFIVLISTI